MAVNSKTIELIKHFEGLHDGDLKRIGLQPKMCPSGIWTEGYGRAMRDSKGKFIRGIENKDLAYSRITIQTIAEAHAALLEDIKIFEKIVDSRIKVRLNDSKRGALVSHTYNTGGSNGLFALVNRNAPDREIRAWFETKYVTGNGVRLKGLINRRKAEADLYFSI